MKNKEFVLPEKWCIMLTSENKAYVQENFPIKNSLNFDSFGAYYYIQNRAIASTNIPKDYTEITFEQFKKYVLKETSMKAKTFAITGSPALLKAMSEELVEAGYILTKRRIEAGDILGQGSNNSCKYNGGNLILFKELGFYGFGTGGHDVTFNLPSEYNEALAFAKAQLAPAMWEEPEVKLPFADLTFTVNKSKGTATCEHGTITKAEIKAVIDTVVSPKARLLDYDLQIIISSKATLTFGCQSGSLSEAQAILKALE